MEKTITIGRYPYRFEIKLTFGTLYDMLDNCIQTKKGWGGVAIYLGGTFNEKMNKIGGRRAAFINVGVELNLKDSRFPTTADNIETAKGLNIHCWGSEQCYIKSFDDEMKQGLYPISADWDGNVYEADFNERGERIYIKAKDFVY